MKLFLKYLGIILLCFTANVVFADNGIITPQLINPTAGSGSDDSAAFNAAIVNLSKNASGSGELYLPPPSSGYYNVCANAVTLPSGSVNINIVGAARGNSFQGVVIRILPSCATPPNGVVALNSAYSGRLRLEHLTLDAWCLSPYDLYAQQATGMTSSDVTYRNAHSGGSNIYLGAGSGNNFSGSNKAENVNDLNHTCYTSTGALPNYNVDNYATNSDFSGFLGVDAKVANFISESTGISSIFYGARGFGYTVDPVAGYALNPQYSFVLYGNAIITGWISTSPSIAGVLLHGYNSTTASNAIVTQGKLLGSVTTGESGIVIDSGLTGALITENNLSALGTPSTAIVQSGIADPSTIVTLNVGATYQSYSQNTVNLSTQATGTLQAAQEPAHTGDVTNTAGSLNTTISAGAVTAAKMSSGAVSQSTVSYNCSPLSGTVASRACHALNVIDDFGAYGDARLASFAVTTTSGSATITFAQVTNQPVPAFSAADIGKPIEIGGAGTGGVVLSTSVASVVSSSQITTVANASTTLSNISEAVMIGHDDTVALNIAFGASALQPVYVPCGTNGQNYRITGQLSIPSSGTVYGRIGNPYYFLRGYQGAGGIYPPPPCNIFIGDGFSSAWSSATAGIVLGGLNHIEGLAIDMQSVSVSLPAIYGKYPWNQVIGNFTVGGLYSLQTDYYSGQDQGWIIENNSFSTATSDCMRLTNITDNVVMNNWAHGCGGSALTLSVVGGTNAIGNVLENSNVSGINFYGSITNTMIVGNKIDNNYYWGLEFQATSGDVTISGNAFYSDGLGTGGANWYVNGANPINITSSGNSYGNGSPYQNLYQANAVGTPSIGSGSTFSEAWPSGATAVYENSAQVVFQPKLLFSPNNLPGPYANDAAAAAAGVPIGAEYHDTSGIRRQRVS